VYPTKISAATVAITSERERDWPAGATRVACSCTESPASVQRNAFERARSVRRARIRAGLVVLVSLAKTAHISSMVRLAAWLRTHLFFVVLFFFILTLSQFSLSRAQFALHRFARGRHRQLSTKRDETGILVAGHVLLRPLRLSKHRHSSTTTTRSDRGFELSPRLRSSKMVIQNSPRRLHCRHRNRNCKS